ncbi:uncharacterized protein [Primulina eburnea]|uniref:uncharacterized protein isoform X4 n=1 Tax=Primulina eburnea TaxID=1245227 RepID=UPI003C6CB347
MSVWVEPSCNLYIAIFTEHWVNYFRWGLKREQDIRLHPRSSRAILVLANPNVCTNQGFCMYNAQFNGLNMLKALFRYLQAKEIQTK